MYVSYYVKDTSETNLYICMDGRAAKVPVGNRWPSKYLHEVCFRGGTLHREREIQDT